jgi:hypothetical protein
MDESFRRYSTLMLSGVRDAFRKGLIGDAPCSIRPGMRRAPRNAICIAVLIPF